MAHEDEMLLSSPDPLALSNENILTPSPVKAKPTRTEDPTIVPRRPLINVSGNARVQDFFISTPPARKDNNSPSKSPTIAASTSPWRIRLTMQAEQVEEKGCEVQRNRSPTKRLAERTTTITVPLKGGDDTPPSVAKRGRGRPRKSLDSPKKRIGTPKPKANGRRKTTPDTQEYDPDNTSLVTTTPPKKARGRPRKSVEVRSDIPQFMTNSLVLTPMAEKVDSAVAEGNITYRRSRGRRNEITPIKIAINESSHQPSILGGGVPVAVEQAPDGVVENGLLRPSPHYQLYHPRLRHSASPLLESSPAISVLKQQDKYISRSVIRSETASPKAGYEEPREQEDIDPTNEHYDNNTILESEGFSMVSVEELASTGNQSNESVKRHSILSDRNDTQAIASSPSEPAATQDTRTQSLPRHVDESREGTPKLARVSRAGIALQGVLSPNDRDQRLGSPFGEPRKDCPLMSAERASTPQAHAPQMNEEGPPKQRLDDLFSGFGVSTRRELRAGLRLGEELAKRQQRFAQKPESSSAPGKDVFRAAINLQYPRLPGSEAQGAYDLTNFSSEKGPRGNVGYARLTRNQIPTPERSEADADEDCMSWEADTPAKSEETAGPTASVLPKIIKERPDESTVDCTMMAREAEWQREREATSMQIEMANKSQVIVIDSDDEEYEDQEQNLDDDEEDSDIWQAEAHSLERSRDATSEASSIMLQPDIIKPRRSKLPSPWRRNSQIIYSDETEPTEADLVRQANQVQAKVLFNLYERKEKPLDSIEASYQPDDSTGALIARQFSPVKGSNIGINTVNEESLYETNDAGPSDDTTPMLITRQLSPVKGFNLPMTGSEASTRSSSIRNAVIPHEALHSEDTSGNPAEADSVPTTLESKYEEDFSEISKGITTITSISDQSVDGFSDMSFEKPLGRAIGNDTTSIDPHLLRPQKQIRKPNSRLERAPRPPIAIQSTIPAQSSWISRLTGPIWSVLTPSPALPPPATRADILCSSPYEPLCQLTPWEPCHMRALGPLYLSSLLYGAHIFPFNPKSLAAAYYGVTVTTSLGWSRTVTERDCSVADAFMVLLEERGYALGEPGEQWIEEGLAIRMCISIWVGMIMRGEVSVNTSNGEKAGLRKQGDRLWTPEDTTWKDNASEYFERKRREFDGLPSWKAMGIEWPPM